jgi:hypothetical protein
MWSPTWPDLRKSAASRRRPRRRPPAVGQRLFLERLEERCMPSVGPLPIPEGRLTPNRFGGPDGHLNTPGPVDSTVPGVGGDPSTITDFNGFIGVAQVTSTGTDNSGNALLWRTDVRFMTGVYRGVDGNLHQGTFAEV